MIDKAVVQCAPNTFHPTGSRKVTWDGFEITYEMSDNLDSDKRLLFLSQCIEAGLSEINQQRRNIGKAPIDYFVRQKKTIS